ncbi:MAG: hypothetical protein ABI876_06420, partial [Bacteroidota bacterium]
AVSLLMVSTIRYDTIPKLNMSGIKKNPSKAIGLLVGIILIGITRGGAIFPLMALYLIFGVVRQLIVMARRSGDDDEEDMEEEEETPFDV